jgi:hypothetical protein
LQASESIESINFIKRNGKAIASKKARIPVKKCPSRSPIAADAVVF